MDADGGLGGAFGPQLQGGLLLGRIGKNLQGLRRFGYGAFAEYHTLVVVGYQAVVGTQPHIAQLVYFNGAYFVTYDKAGAEIKGRLLAIAVTRKSRCCLR